MHVSDPILIYYSSAAAVWLMMFEHHSSSQLQLRDVDLDEHMTLSKFSSVKIFISPSETRLRIRQEL